MNYGEWKQQNPNGTPAQFQAYKAQLAAQTSAMRKANNRVGGDPSSVDRRVIPVPPVRRGTGLTQAIPNYAPDPLGRDLDVAGFGRGTDFLGSWLDELEAARSDYEMGLAQALIDARQAEIDSVGAGSLDRIAKLQRGLDDVNANEQALLELLATTGDYTAGRVRDNIDPSIAARGAADISAAYANTDATGGVDYLNDLANMIAVGESGIGVGPATGDEIALQRQLGDIANLSRQETKDVADVSANYLEALAGVADVGRAAAQREARTEAQRSRAAYERSIADENLALQAALADMSTQPLTMEEALAEVRRQAEETERIEGLERTMDFGGQLEAKLKNVEAKTESPSDLFEFFMSPDQTPAITYIIASGLGDSMGITEDMDRAVIAQQMVRHFAKQPDFVPLVSED